jgi:hypothetical protein
MDKFPIKDGKPEDSATPGQVSKLSKRLREISDKALASGMKVLSRDEIRKVLLEARGGSS